MTALLTGFGGSAGFGTMEIPSNDDGSSMEIDLSAVFEDGLNFFGREYSSLWVNNNGSVTFEAPRATFTPNVITENNNNPEITPFFADVDTRGGMVTPDDDGTSTGANAVWYELDTDGDRFVVTWDDVGYFNSHTDLTNAFQLVLTDRGAGDFDIQFRYEDVNWTTGDASQGDGGLGGEVARAGFTASVDEPGTEFELPASGDQDAMLALDEVEGNTGEIGIWEFAVRTGAVFPGGVPDLPELTGGATGDPHLVTIDGVPYSFQAVGEYVLLEESDDPDGFALQARFSPAGDAENASEIAALAMRVGETEVMFDPTADIPLVINGTPTTIEGVGTAAIEGGAIAISSEGTYRVIFAGEDGVVNDGDSQVEVTLHDNRLDMQLALSDELAGNVQGLLGDADGNPDNDIALADGTVLDRPLNFAELYGDYRDDWRVSDADESLFTYASGEGPDSFYDAAFPGALTSLDDFTDAEIATAEAAVAAAGLAEGSVNYNNALLDFLLTGDESFITSAADTPALPAADAAEVDPETFIDLSEVDQGGTEENTANDDDDGDDDDDFGGLGLLLLLALGAAVVLGMGAV